ncbi:hypothetical protein B0A50_01823 [Salinomyces thailandicus]|uniref:Uncharacterized protein n=1 Tax=Salinomyces thailandicus TaxID=706561 RepID=A0A4U0UBV0_9PEZI|nr:hypothetical protein B0A50_01823 [Salinomyces thailandica]
MTTQASCDTDTDSTDQQQQETPTSQCSTVSPPPQQEEVQPTVDADFARFLNGWSPVHGAERVDTESSENLLQQQGESVQAAVTMGEPGRGGLCDGKVGTEEVPGLKRQQRGQQGGASGSLGCSGFVDPSKLVRSQYMVSDGERQGQEKRKEDKVEERVELESGERGSRKLLKSNDQPMLDTRKHSGFTPVNGTNDAVAATTAAAPSDLSTAMQTSKKRKLVHSCDPADAEMVTRFKLTYLAPVSEKVGDLSAKVMIPRRGKKTEEVWRCVKAGCRVCEGTRKGGQLSKVVAKGHGIEGAVEGKAGKGKKEGHPSSPQADSAILTPPASARKPDSQAGAEAEDGASASESSDGSVVEDAGLAP